jgi:two-component system, OmpR family, response regulator
VARILVVDDDAHIREVVRFALEKAGHRVREAGDGRAALADFAAAGADLVVLDILMPELDGIEVCRELRSQSAVPILFLSSRDEELDRVLGLELVARVKGILRRAQRSAGDESPAPAIIERGALRVDLDRHACSWAGRAITLTVTEFDLLHSLLGMPGKVYTREELVERAYGAGHHITDRTVDSHVRRIRRKFKECGADPIETVYGLGYRLAVGDGNAEE